MKRSLAQVAHAFCGSICEEWQSIYSVSQSIHPSTCQADQVVTQQLMIDVGLPSLGPLLADTAGASSHARSSEPLGSASSSEGGVAFAHHLALNSWNTGCLLASSCETRVCPAIADKQSTPQAIE
eukprot:4336640-Amphidinium_carterae.1